MGKDNANIVIILTKHLKKLSKAGLEDFVVALCDLKPPRGYNQIQRERLEGKTPKQMAEFIMRIYTNRYGPAKVRQALKNSHQNQIRTDLEKELREESKTTKSTVKVETSGGAANRKRVKEEQRGNDVKPKRRRGQKTDEEHFVNQNRTNLIKLITDVEPVLDDLMEKELLTQEQYDVIGKKETSQAKMRELYRYVRSWQNLKVKNTLLEILKKHNPVVIKNLLGKSKAKKK
ncbi:uncharacterized protein LOC122944600 isoform X2 [Bufo gargarizans]|uniref:uncharacterized protein LOC122944600 isoform X2 n=1 Tax=Bufo gargarizans TaxID=30331 RepID=UPI001CF3E2A7|nr:uncharacterized protein LOC122944600 isoform X2 [Bufo gargarizans]